MSRHTPLQVSDTPFKLLQMELINYFIIGHGAHYFPTPPGAPNAEATLAKRRRIEALGQDLGARLVERYAKDRDRMEADLDMVKFVCKDFWELTFGKQVDVLRTNHRGLYVLTDNNFRWLSSVSREHESQVTPEDFVILPCGLVCGALTRLGVKCRVTAELIPLPTSYKCSFNVQVIQN